jgi:hypothetical protein
MALRVDARMASANCLGKKGPDIGPFVVGGVVWDDMNDALIGGALFDLGQKRHGTDAIYGRGLDQRGFEGLEVHSPVIVQTTTPRRAQN